MKLIDIKNLSKVYHTPTKEVLALSDLNFAVYEGEILGIVGSSGCGKSTLLNILTKLEKATSGEVQEKKDLTIGYMMQNDALLPWLTVYDNALLGLKLEHLLTEENKEYVNSLLKRYGLYDFKKEYPSSLSGGMRQRLALIRTLAIKPNILLLDEPFSKLDIDARLNISDDVYKIIKELHITTILISHDIGEASSMCDRIIIMTKRPGTIKKIFGVNFDRDMLPSKRRLNDEFHNLYNKIWENIDHVN